MTETASAPANNVLYAIDNGVAVITINRPACRDAVTVDMVLAIVGWLDLVDSDPAVAAG